MNNVLLSRLSSLFSKDMTTKLVYISNIGVLAGGAITFALNTFVPKHTVNDLDVFVNSEEDVKKICEYCRGRNSDTVDRGTNIKICNIFIEGEKFLIQAIIYPFENPLEVIERFDIDAVQCAFHKGELFRTERCIEAHKQRTVLKFRLNYGLFNRLVKMEHKGFKVPLISTCDDDLKYTFGCYSKWLQSNKMRIVSRNEKLYVQQGHLEYEIRKAVIGPEPGKYVFIDFNHVTESEDFDHKRNIILLEYMKL